MLQYYFEDLLQISPSLAYFLGHHTPHTMSTVEVSIGPDWRNKYKLLVQAYQKRLHDYHPPQSNKHAVLDSKLLQQTLKEAQKEIKCDISHLMPISSFNNPIIEFAFMEKQIYTGQAQQPKHTKSRYLCYIEFIKQAIVNMREGIQRHITIPSAICKKAIDDMENFISSKSYITNSTLAVYLTRHYEPHLKTLVAFMQKEYLPHCRDTIGYCNIPGGKAEYRRILSTHTTLPISPQQVHELGLKEVARITRALKNSLAQMQKAHQDLTAAFNAIMNDPSNLFKNKADALAAYRAEQDVLRKTVIPKHFYDQVEPYEVQAVSKEQEASAPGAFIYPATKTRPGVFYINLRDLRENPRFTVNTLSAHEGIPGHHYQFKHMLEHGVQEYRIYACDNDAYTEGWALYAESLVPHKDPLTTFGRLNYEMLRAVRCVVDTGVHYYGWDYNKALNYMKTHLAFQESELTSELDRYICIPGQATAYKVGERFFMDLRRRYLKRSPNKTTKDYHQAVLSHGVLPLSILEKQLRTTIT